MAVVSFKYTFGGARVLRVRLSHRGLPGLFKRTRPFGVEGDGHVARRSLAPRACRFLRDSAESLHVTVSFVSLRTQGVF